MRTTVHLPPDLLASVDRRAEALGVSRNRYIIRALERAVAAEAKWSLELREVLERVRNDEESRELLRDLREAVAARRSSKTAPPL